MLEHRPRARNQWTCCANAPGATRSFGKLALGDDDLRTGAIARIVTGLDPATGIYEQFAGFTRGNRSTSPLCRTHRAYRRGDWPRADATLTGGEGPTWWRSSRCCQEFPGAMARRFFATTSRAAPAVRSARGCTQWSPRAWAYGDGAALSAETAAPTSTSTPTAPVACASPGWARCGSGDRLAGLDLRGDRLRIDPRLRPNGATSRSACLERPAVASHRRQNRAGDAGGGRGDEYASRTRKLTAGATLQVSV